MPRSASFCRFLEGEREWRRDVNGTNVQVLVYGIIDGFLLAMSRDSSVRKRPMCADLPRRRLPGSSGNESA